MHRFYKVFCATIVGMGCAVNAASQKQNLSWQMQESGTTAGLRGIDSVDGKMAWASGTEGTVLRTIDGGEHWQKCAVPDGDKDGATLDFRGVQAWDEKTAIVMASGPGEKSRLYRTTDGCVSWTELVRNHDKDGFWDGTVKAYLDDGTHMLLLGDPVGGRFYLRRVNIGAGEYSTIPPLRLFAEPGDEEFLKVNGDAGAFAASNSSLLIGGTGVTSHKLNLFVAFGTGGSSGAAIYRTQIRPTFEEDFRSSPWVRIPVPIAGSNASSGIFSLASGSRSSPKTVLKLIAVGGDYAKPSENAGTAAHSRDGGLTWTPATKLPHGFRSSVAWSEDLKAWITVGTNGSDISRDDGKTWQSFDDGNWNALSLPFVVGPKGRIGKLAAVGK